MDIVVDFKGGASLVNYRPLFSVDGENVFVCCKNSVLEYNTKTGKLVYEYIGLADPIVGFSYHTYDSYQCITAISKSSRIIVWKTITHYKLFDKRLFVKKIKTFNVFPSKGEDDIIALVSYLDKKFIQFALVNIKTQVCKNVNLKFKFNKQRFFVDISGNKYFSVAQGNDIYFGKLNSDKVTRCYIQSRTFTCIACHPSEEIVLTGDSSGRVLVWRNIFGKEKTQAVFHWHTLPVQTVCFSTAGSYFYSGGDECVLVKWQLDNANNRKFLPRIAAEIAHISVANNNLYIAVASRDNAIRILNPGLDQVTLIQHMVLGKQYEGGIIYDPRTKALVMNGHQGHVQFYSPTDMSLLYSVDVVGQNKITNERDCIIQNTEIRKIAISKTGIWLSTVEERNDTEFHNEIRLKFWKFNSEKQIFELNTSIEYPHERSITNILFQPLNSNEDLYCVTVGDDRKFKVWQLVEVSTVYKNGIAWKCASAGFYRNLSCSTLSFSVDGSLIAIGFGSILTTWTLDTCELKSSLAHPFHREIIKHVQFGYRNHCHLLVAASANQLSVWNILTLSMIWTVPVRTSLLIADPLSTHMAVFTSDKKIFIFCPDSHKPIYSSDNLLKKYGEIVAASFVPSKYSNDPRLQWYERSRLYFINSNNLFCIRNNEYNIELSDGIEDGSKSLFNMMRPKSELRLAGPLLPSRHIFEKDVGHKIIKKYLEAPIHTTAPVRFMCHSLVRSLVIQKEIVS